MIRGWQSLKGMQKEIQTEIYQSRKTAWSLEGEEEGHKCDVEIVKKKKIIKYIYIG